MEHMISKMSFAMVVMAMLCAGAAAQSSCTNVIVTLSPCLNYITGNSSTPSSGCCSQISSVLSSKSQAQCLCQVLNGGGSSLGININQTQALNLPSACKLKNTPSVSQCKASSPSPAKAPAGTATGTAAESPNSPTSDPSG
ncbi:Non-specific lipid transfer protein GPI-anchored 5, partial [Stylosanthes scabra]|nr:Non-specific lipid transfer protein GPI-anchored 5 [Stylosanthes scabra]